MRSLYIHFPFCESKCHYCDFYSLGRERTRAEDPAKFELALRKECEISAQLLAPTLDTIFFGGGTPSMTAPDSMKRALEPLALSNRITPETEWTMEANPSSIELEKFREYRALGINRVSMGVQAMRDEMLTKLGRVHSRNRAIEALNTVFSAGFENVSTDLLCGVPGQTLADLEEALQALTAFPIQHLSCYLLTLPPHHRMYRDLPNEDTQLEHLLFVDSWMKNRGFRHYEISNYARPGREARHNLQYWKSGSYLGLGPSAHSFDGNRRWKNVSSLHVWANRLTENNSPVEWSENLTESQKNLENWMLALRLDEGFPAAWLASPFQRSRALALEQNGLLENHPDFSDRKRLTARGFALSDQIVSTLAENTK